MRKKYRAAIVGLGKQACSDYVPGFARSDLASVVAVCDPDEEILAKMSHMLDVPAYRDHEQLLAAERLDFIFVAAPHREHRAVTEAAARASVHVLKEKPFAVSLADALHMKAVAEQYDVHIMTALQRRFDPIYQSYFQISERIGDPFFVDARYTMYVDAPHAGWRGSREMAGGGCVIDMGYHMLDLLIWYLGMPVAVAANISCDAVSAADYDAEDTASLLLRWEDGLHGTCVLSRFVPPKTELLRVVGSGGMIELERSTIRRLASDGEVVDLIAREQSHREVATAQIDYFCRVLDGDRPNLDDPGFHVQHAALIDACYRSATTRSMVNPMEVLSSCTTEAPSRSTVVPVPFPLRSRTSSGRQSMPVRMRQSLGN